jgi:predicted transcriptional regulator
MSEYTKLCIHVPKAMENEKMVERLAKIGKSRDRTVSYLIIQAVAEFLQREEAKK